MSLPLPGSDLESTGVSDVMVTVDLAEEPVPSQFHTTVVVHSSSEPSPGLTFDEAVDVISTSTSQLSVSEEPAAAVDAVQELESAAHEGTEPDVVAVTPVVTSTSVPPSAPRGLFGRHSSSRTQATAQDSASLSMPFGGGHHSSGARSNNELAHNAVMDALFRRHSKAEAAASVRRQLQDVNTRTTSAANQTSGGSSNSMSVSVPNLTSTMEQTVNLLETFAMVARRNLGNNSGNVMSAVAGSNNNPCSSLVRLALSSNSPGNSDALIFLSVVCKIYICNTLSIGRYY